MINKQMGRDCLALIKKFFSDEPKMTREEKYLGMMGLHKKYPDAGFYQTAQSYADGQLRQQVKQEIRDMKAESAADYLDGI